MTERASTTSTARMDLFVHFVQGLLSKLWRHCLCVKPGHPNESTVSTAVHGLRRERAGEGLADKDEILILAWPAHPVVASRPTNDEQVPPALIGADEIPALVPDALVFVQLGRA